MKKNKSLISLFEEHAAQKSLFGDNESILLMMSAGKDSVAMLHLFLQVREKYNLQLAVFHLNHSMRGVESDEDALFVAELAARHGIPLISYNHDFEGVSNFEETARKKRYELAEKISAEKNISRIATAHTKSDLMETVLMRIFTGTSYSGLNAVKHKKNKIIRPLLFASAHDVYAHLASNNLTWREDSSNRDTAYTRNYIRSSVLPRVFERFHNAEDAVYDLAQSVEELTASLDEIAASYIAEDEMAVRISPALVALKSVFFYSLAKILKERYSYLITRARLENIHLKIISSDKHNIRLYENELFAVTREFHSGAGFVVIRDSGEAECGSVCVKIRDISGIYPVSSFGVQMQIIENSELPAHSPDMLLLALGENDEIIMRKRRPGDRVIIKGNRIKVKDVLINSKVVPYDKERIPVIEINGEVASVLTGVLGYGNNRTADRFMVKEGSKKILAIGRLKKL
jgi:tRNA(Ile)-lysidine synthase